MINFYKMHYELDSFFSVSSFKLHFISAKFEDFFCRFRNPSTNYFDTKAKGNGEVQQCCNFLLYWTKDQPRKKIPFREANLQTCPFKFGRPLLLKQSSFFFGYSVERDFEEFAGTFRQPYISFFWRVTNYKIMFRIQWHF